MKLDSIKGSQRPILSAPKGGNPQAMRNARYVHK